MDNNNNNNNDNDNNNNNNKGNKYPALEMLLDSATGPCYSDIN